MTLHRFIDYLKIIKLSKEQFETLLSSESVRDIVSTPISLEVAERYGYKGNEKEIIVENITEINRLIDEGIVYFLQYKKQSIADIFTFNGHNRKKIDPIVDVSMSASFY